MMIKVHTALVLIGVFAHAIAQNNFFNISEPSYASSSFGSNFESSMTVTYEIEQGSSGTYPDSVEVRLFAAGCAINDELSLTGDVVNIDSVSYSQSSSFSYAITVDSVLIATSSLVDFSSSTEIGPSSIGTIEFCTRVTSHLDELESVSIYSRLSDWNIGFNIASLDITLLGQDVSVADISVTDVDTTTPNTISIAACQCSLSDYSCTSSSLSNGDVLYFCLKPDTSVVEITNFDLSLSNGDFSYTPIAIGSGGAQVVSDSLTSISQPSGNIVFIETIMVSNLFEQSSNTVSISGSALLQFSASSSKTIESYPFNAVVEVKQENCKLASSFKTLVSQFKELVS